MRSQGRPAGSVERTPSPGRTGKLKHSPWTAERDRKKKRHGEAPTSINEDTCLHVASETHWYQGLYQQQHIAPGTSVPQHSCASAALRPRSAGTLPTAPSDFNNPAACSIYGKAEPAVTGVWGSPHWRFHVGGSRNSSQRQLGRFAQPAPFSANPLQAGLEAENTCEVHSCDYPGNVSAPADPIALDACSADFASTAVRRPAFAAAFYFTAGLRKFGQDQLLPVLQLDSQGPLAAGAQNFSPALVAAEPVPQACQDHAAMRRPVMRGVAALEQRASPSPVRSEPSPSSHMDTDSGNGAVNQQCIPVLGSMRIKKAAQQSSQQPQQQQQQHRVLWSTPLRKLRGRSGSPNAIEQEPEMQPLGAGLHAAAADRTGQFYIQDNAENTPIAGRPATSTFTCLPTVQEGQRMTLNMRSPLGDANLIRTPPGAAQLHMPPTSAVKLQAKGSTSGHGLHPRGHSRTSSLSSLGTADTTSSCSSPMLTDPPHCTLGRLQAVAEMSAADVSMDSIDAPLQHPQLICTRTQLRQWQLTNDSLQSQALESPAASLARVGIIESSSPFSDATTPGPPSTDDDDLKCSQAVANGDAETVGQAWRDVKSGNVKPDIDSLNQLLRSFCRIHGDPPLKEATEMVSRAGCPPNAATYRELTALSIRHEQLSDFDCHPPHHQEPQHFAPSSIYVTP